MKDFNLFLAERVKSKNLTIPKLIERLGISRATFYRYQAKPSDIKMKTLQILALELSLSVQECFDYFGKAPEELIAYEKERREKIYTLTEYTSVLDGINTKKEFIFFDKHIREERNKYSKSEYSSEELAHKLLTTYSDDDERKKDGGYYNHKFSVYLYNCSTIKQTSIIARLLFTISKEMYDLNKSLRIQVIHYIQDDMIDNNEVMKLSLLKETLPLHSVTHCYVQEKISTTSNFWGNNDICLIKYSRLFVPKGSSIDNARSNPNRSRDYNHFFINFLSEKDITKGYICPLGEPCYLFNFFSFEAADKHSRIKFYKINEINDLCISNIKKHKTMLIGSDFCFDSIPTDIWSEHLENIEKEKNAIEMFKYLNKVLGGEIEQKDTSPESLKKLLEGVKERYDAKSKRGDINIFHQRSIEKFVENRMISDLLQGDTKDAPIFSNQLMLKILTFMKKSIEGEENGQKYYFLNKSEIPESGVKLCLMQDSCTQFIDDRIYCKNIFWSDNIGKEITENIMNFWMGEIENRSDNQINRIMTDTEALRFLDKMIAMIK